MSRAFKAATSFALAYLLTACGGIGSNAIPNRQIDSGFSTSGDKIMLGSGVLINVMHPYRAPISVIGINGGSGPGEPLVTYFGGRVQRSQKIYLVFWGSLWKTTGDPDRIAPLLTAFFNGLRGSEWESTLTQYHGANGYVTNAARLAGSWTDTAHQPAWQPTDAQIGAEAAIAAAHFGDYSVDASYVVVMPHGHNPAQFGANGYCAYHLTQQTPHGTIAYANFPYIPDAGHACGAGTVNKPGRDDGVTIAAGHEQAGMATDPIDEPGPTGWYSPLYAEIPDVCAWAHLQNTAFSTGTFPTQPLWSDKAAVCVQ